MFDASTTQYLHTGVGTIDLGAYEMPRPVPTSSGRLSPHVIGYGLNKDRTWVTYGGQDLVWLPPEYRPEVMATSEDNIALGCPSGRVLVLRFSREPDTL